MSDPALELRMAIFAHDDSLANIDLSKFVVQEHSNEPSESGYSKVRESQLSGSETIVEEWNVGDGDLKKADENQTQVSSVVNHTLLRDGQSSCLSNN